MSSRECCCGVDDDGMCNTEVAVAMPAFSCNIPLAKFRIDVEDLFFVGLLARNA
jgi:hypothetical protein